jgi:hypothetical protein
MVRYACEKCEKVWDRKSVYEQHLRRKKPCVAEIVDIKKKTVDVNQLVDVLNSCKEYFVKDSIIKNNYGKEISKIDADADADESANIDRENITSTHNKPKAIKINKKYYYNANKLMKYDPVYFKGVFSVRKIIEKKNISEDQYIYAYIVDGEWKESNKSYPKAKLFIRKKYVEENIPKMIPNASIEEINKMYDFSMAPDILELDDNEKFKDSHDNIIEIEVRGNRNYKECYFLMEDVMEGFKLKNLYNTILHKNGDYNKDVHYKYFISKKNENFTNFESKKNAFSKTMYLTYIGLIRTLVTSRSKYCEQFQDWAMNILFTHHLGTEKQKDILASSLLGISPKTIKDVFRTSSDKTPVIYLFLIGKANRCLSAELLKENNYDDNILLCKFGRTEDIVTRTSQHEARYKKEFASRAGKNVNIELLIYSIIDPKFLQDAESNIREYFKADRLDGQSELILIDKSRLQQVKEHYKRIQISFIGRYQEIEKELTKIKYEKELTDMRHEKELTDMRHEKELADVRHEKETAELRHKNEILELKLKIAEQ